MDLTAIPIPTGLTLSDLLDAVDHHPVAITKGREDGGPCYPAAFGMVRHQLGAVLLGVGDLDALRSDYATAHVITLDDASFDALRLMATERAEAVEHARQLQAGASERLVAA